MITILVVTVTLLFCTIGVESRVVPCTDLSSNPHFRGDNIVLKLNRNVSHTPNTYGDDKYNARFAADDNCDTFFSENSPYTCSMTDKNNGTSPTWTVPFDKSYQITGIVIYNRDILRQRLANFTIYGKCDGAEKVVLYNDAGENKYLQEVIQLEITDTHICSTISIQIPQYSVSGHVQYLTLCEVLVYTAVCSKPTTPFITNISPNKSLYNKEESLNFDCKPGYRPSPSNRTVTCCGVDKFCPSPVCQIVYCQLPNQPDNGKYISTSTNTSLEYGTTITGVCDNGYKTEISDTTRTCQQNEEWSGQDLVCTQIVCTPPARVQHGYYTYTNDSEYNYINVTYNTYLTGHCILGYKLTNPSSTISCGLNESWIGNLSVCNIVTCDPPAAIQNGYYRYANNTNYTEKTEEYNTTLFGECNIGYKLSSPSPNERRCSQHGNWIGGVVVCDRIKCKSPVLVNGNYTGETAPFYFNDQLTPICDEGYRLSNNDTIVCDENGLFNDTATCVLLENESDSQVGSSNIGMIVGVVAAIAVCVALMVIVCIIIMRRKNSNGDKSRETKTMNNAAGGEYANVQETRFANAGTTGASKAQGIYENSALNGQQDAEGTPAVNDDSANAYYSFQGDDSVPLTAIKLENLSDIVLKGDRAQAQFKEQFESLPFGMTEPFVVARQEDNIGKNRYKNLFAYDHSRVVLQKDRPDQSDYINACYVDGYSRPNAYIASQGPTKTTLGDFWRMIWQSDCNKIVMLTNLIEEGKSKCIRYWPEDKEEVFDNIIVKLEKTESFSEFVVRSMSMTKNDMGTKKVTQFHFTAWPDKGVPKYASSLVQFRHKVTYAQPARNNPIIVHCSAGIGRTGTFVALDFLTEQAKEMGYVDVFGAVKAMRKQRVNFVQTLEQYTFLHHALVETLMLSTSALPSSKFPQWYKSILQFDQSKKKRKINVEFETLSRLSPTADEWQYTNAKQPNNRTKNRYSNILPMQEFMPRLDQLDDTNSDTTYINAVFLPSYKQKDAFIVTQTPLVETKDDFWRLVWEHDIHVIVMMNNMDETTEEEQYWPNDDCTVTSGNLVIAHKTTKHEKYCKTVKMQVQNKLVTRSIVQVQFGGWKTYEKLPDSKDSILSLFETIQSLQRTVGNQPLLVHCMNGVDKSGLYCVISAVLERMKIEQDVAITQVIEEMRKAREQIIPSIEQFEFCHQVVLAYIEEYSTYSNFTL